jgi:hypothetical protein
MSSIRNSQNLLTNVFRPTYSYDGTGFNSSLVATNIKSLDVNTVRATVVSIGDAGGNVYIGTGAGVTYLASASNSNNTAFGVNAAAGLSNSQRSVFIGANAGFSASNTSNSVIIGTDANSFGTTNIIVGNGSYVSGSNNIVIGTDISLSDSYKFKVGNVFSADLSSSAALSVAGVSRFDASVGVFRDPQYGLDVSGRFRVSDASGSLVFSNGTTIGYGFITSNGAVGLGPNASEPLYPIRRGITNIAVVSRVNPNDYVFGPLYVQDTCTGTYTPDQSKMISNGNLSIVYNNITSYIQISNLAGSSFNVDWSVLCQPV